MSVGANINLELLRYLKRQDRPVPPDEIEARLGLEHGDLIRDLEALASEGYEIELHPYLGARLVDIPDRLLAHEINEDLNTKVIGRKLNIYDTCASTNDEAWAAVEARRADDGELFIAEHQTSARGRMGRRWESARGAGLYCSFVLRMKLAPEQMAYITSAAALAVANTIEQFTHLPSEIKWPNDILVGGRKVAGILVEARSNHPDVYVVGIGLNVNQRQTDFPEHLQSVATSLRIERKGGPIHRIRLLRPLLFYLDGVFAQIRRKKFDRVSRAWKEYVRMTGRRVTLRCDGADHVGELTAIDPGEGIKLKLAGGAEKTFRAEHVSTMTVVE